MIIDNIFNIKTYLGSQPLPLFNAPSHLVNNSTYTNFLNNVSIIYGTQTTNGSIPTFYKTNNIADSRSSLRFLEPQQSYYFISKADAVLPYNIPVSGTILPSPYKNCPTVDVIPSRVSLNASSGNYYYLVNDVSNLNIAYPYTYEVKVVSSNWKVSALAASGTVASSQSSNTIISALRFDTDAGVTDYSNFLPPNTSVSQIDKNNLFAIVEVSLNSEQNLDCPKIIDLMLLQCNNCIPVPSPTPTPTVTATPTSTPTPTPTRTPAAVFNNQLTIVTNMTPVSDNGVSMNASVGDRLDYTLVSPRVGQGRAINIFISSVQVARVDYTADYVGRTFRFTRASTGLSYIGTFSDTINGNVNF
jgi:hypothetical protein